MDEPERTKDRILYLLKAHGPQTAGELAQRLGVTPMAVRQHLAALERDGLVDATDVRRPVGRPARSFRLTEGARGRFPDAHAELTVEMLACARAAFGEDGLERLVAERARRQLDSYRASMPGPGSPLRARVAALARAREREGYMASWERAADGAYVLIENHCPICTAARACQGLCSAELDLFRAILGPDVTVERTEHLLAGARRCTYSIAPRAARPPRKRPR